MESKIFHIYSPISVETKASNSKILKIAGYANTTDKDRSGDVISAQAWAKGVDYYRKNPVLLYQHDHSKPIGRVDKIIVDKKGLYVEASVSQAAETLHGVKTLINDGALKSFSVGFVIKNGHYDKNKDTTVITDVELHEISVVSVPCNQESLFSIKKSFENNDAYENFKKSLKLDSDDAVNTKNVSDIQIGVTSNNEDHYHTIEVDKNGNGVTTYSSHNSHHYHRVVNYRIEEAKGHNHEIVFLVKPSDSDSTPKEDPRPKSPSEAPEAYSSSLVLYSMSEENTNMTDKTVDSNPSTNTKSIEAAKAETIETDVDNTEVKAVDEEADDQVEKTITEEEAIVARASGKNTEDDEEVSTISSNPYEPIPFVNLLNAETQLIKAGDTVKVKSTRYKVEEIATAQDANFKLLEIDLNNKSLDNIISIPAEEISVTNFWDIGSKYDLYVNHTSAKSLTDSERQSIATEFDELVTIVEQDLYAIKDKNVVKDNSFLQEKLNKTINLVTVPKTEWNDTNYHIAKTMINNIKILNSIDCNGEETSKNLALSINGHNTTIKEKETMATESVGDPIVVNTGAKASNESSEIKASSVQVGKNRAETLIETTGAAVLKEADEVDRKGVSTASAREDLAELKAQLDKYKDEIKAITESKHHYQEQSRSVSQYSERDIANAYFLAKALRKDPENIAMGRKMLQTKAITSVDQFLSNFSTNVYEEMEQQLVIAPLFDRIPVDSKTFRIPIADESTEDYVAQFASGTYATGVGDTTNVPTTRQHTIASVDFTPHKFMVTTHLAKDEEEDTILPLIDFLRRAATRRLARSYDKALLRGTGALTGFTANPAGTATYASVIKGITTMVNQVATDGLSVRTADGDTKASAANIASARAKMGKYGLQLGSHLIYLTTIEGYNELVTTSDFRTVDKFGPNATYLTGSVGAIYGIPVVVTEFLDNVGSNSADIGALVYKPGWMLAERRGMEIESEYEPRQQVTAMYMSTRFDFKALSTVGSGANVDATYGFASTIRTLA